MGKIICAKIKRLNFNFTDNRNKINNKEDKNY